MGPYSINASTIHRELMSPERCRSEANIVGLERESKGYMILTKSLGIKRLYIEPGANRVFWTSPSRIIEPDDSDGVYIRLG